MFFCLFDFWGVILGLKFDMVMDVYVFEGIMFWLDCNYGGVLVVMYSGV